MNWLFEANSNEGPIKAAGFLIIMGSGLVFQGVRKALKARRVQDLAKIPIGSAPAGLVEIQGYAWPYRSETTAVSGRHCVLYDIEIQEYRRQGKNSSWVRVFHKSSQEPFLIGDGSGICIVDPAQADLDVTAVTTNWKKLTPEMVSKVGEIAGRAYSVERSWLFDSNRRLIEKKIFIGSPVHVIGTLMPHPVGMNITTRPGFSTFLAKAVELGVNPSRKLRQFDTDRSGHICDRELVVGFHGMAVSVSHHESRSEEPQGEIKVVGLVSAAGPHKLAISDCHEDRLVKRLGRYNVLSIVAGALMIGAGVWVLAYWWGF